jgi:hypothetical protein
MRMVPLTVLVYEGPMARAYLGAMRLAGYRPEQVIVMVQERDLVSGKPILPWLPTSWRTHLAARGQDLRMNFWPRALYRRHPRLVEACLAALEAITPHAAAFLPYLIETSNYPQFTDRVDSVLVDGVRDVRLSHLIERSPRPRCVLFTGGGILPKTLLDIEQVRFLHVHPGHLPEVRGADGLLWSVLLRGVPGASCFYMSPGIDEGKVILTRDLPMVNLPPEFLGLSLEERYNLLYSFVDPIIRAAVLLDVLTIHSEDLLSMPVSAQALEAGRQYHFLAPQMRDIVSRLFATLD